MSRKLSVSIFLIALSVFGVAAQGSVSASDTEPLTLSAAMAEARARNPDLHALRTLQEAARAAPASERFLTPPTLEAQIWSWPVTTLNPARTDMYMFTAEQQLPGRGKRAARALVAERDADVAREQVEVRVNEILTELKHAYIDLALARELRAAYESQRRLLEDLTEAAAARYASGEGGQHHTVVSLVELTRLEKDRTRADERVQTAEARLNAIMGRPITSRVGSLAPILPTLVVAGAETTALSRHPELSEVDAAIAREEAELARVRGERRPDFVLGGGYMLMPGDAGAVTFKGGITWPNAPWSRGRLSAEVDAQVKRLEASKARRDAVAARVRRSVRDATIRIVAAQRQAQLIDSTVMPQVEHAFELARVSYAGGEGTFMDVVESGRLLLTTRLEAAEARANTSQAFVDLESAVGVP